MEVTSQAENIVPCDTNTRSVAPCVCFRISRKRPKVGVARRTGAESRAGGPLSFSQAEASDRSPYNSSESPNFACKRDPTSTQRAYLIPSCSSQTDRTPRAGHVTQPTRLCPTKALHTGGLIARLRLALRPAREHQYVPQRVRKMPTSLRKQPHREREACPPAPVVTRRRRLCRRATPCVTIKATLSEGE
jgi:hypothetical protein